MSAAAVLTILFVVIVLIVMAVAMKHWDQRSSDMDQRRRAGAVTAYLPKANLPPHGHNVGMCSYAIVLADRSHGPGFPSVEEAAEWALANLPDDQLTGWVSVAVTEDGETSVSMGLTLSREGGA